MPNEGLGNEEPALTRHYKRLLAGAGALEGGGGGLETLSPESTAGPSVDLSASAVDERLSGTRAELHRIVEEFLGDKGELHEIADEITGDGKTALRLVADETHAGLASAQILASLEVVVRTDGSRPSFMVRKGCPIAKRARQAPGAPRSTTLRTSCAQRSNAPAASMIPAERKAFRAPGA